jgi:hypothetical protein
MEQQQKQRERRQSQTQYQGEDRRKHDHDPIFDEPTVTPANPGMSTQERKDEQAERVRQQRDQHDDIH